MYIRVKVSPSAKKEIFKQINEDHFEVSVKEKAERNLANNRVIELFELMNNPPKMRICYHCCNLFKDRCSQSGIDGLNK